MIATDHQLEPTGAPAMWEDGLSGVSSGMLAAVLLVLGVGLLAWVVSSMRSQDRLRRGPAYRRLSRTLGLGRADRRLLWHMAREAGSPCPAALLISSGCFDHAARRYISRRGRPRRLTEIRRLVFESGG